MQHPQDLQVYVVCKKDMQTCKKHERTFWLGKISIKTRKNAYNQHKMPKIRKKHLKPAKTPFWPRYSTYWGKIARSSSSLLAMFILFPCFYLLCSYRWPRFTSLIDYQRIIWLKSHLKESDPANSRCCEYLHKVRDGRRLFFSIYIFLVFFIFVRGWLQRKKDTWPLLPNARTRMEAVTTKRSEKYMKAF